MDNNWAEVRRQLDQELASERQQRQARRRQQPSFWQSLRQRWSAVLHWTMRRHRSPARVILAGLAVALLLATQLSPAHAATPGTVFGWGYNSDGQATVPASLAGAQAIAVAGGFYHSVVAKSDGTVVAWGANFAGQLNVPGGLTGVTAVAAGIGHSLALKSDGTVVGWGDNGLGQLNFPPGLTGVTGIAAGYLHSLALKSDGSVIAVGLNDRGQTNVPAGLTGVVAIAANAGGDFSLALKSDGTVVGWGDNGSGQLNFPAGLTGIRAIAAGGTFSLLLKNDGTVIKVGGGPAVPAGLTGVTAITAGFTFGLASKSDGSLVAWGDSAVAAIPAGFKDVTAMAGGYGQALVIGSPDATAPSVSINQAGGQDDPASTNPVLFTAEFSEPVTGFTPADVTLAGTANLAGATVSVSGGPSSFTISVGGLAGSGTVIASLAPNVATDVARNGNTASTSSDNTVTVNFDSTPPVITPNVVGTLGSNGWYVGDVSVTWSVTDPESTVTSQTGCDAQSVTSDTAGVTFSCAAASGGGGGSQNVTVKRDATAPTISAAATTAANGAGWYNSNVTVHFTCGDNLSGVTSCPADQVLSSEGSAVASTAQTIVDNAGNSSAASNVVTVKIDKSVPVFGACPVAGPFALNSGQKTITQSAPNASISGLAAGTLTGSVDTSSSGSKSVTFSATDNAGNTATQQCSYAVNSPPTLAVAADGAACLSDSSAKGVIKLVIGDADGGLGSLTLSLVSSSNTSLVPTKSAVLGGSGANRTLTVTAAAKKSGTALLTLRVSDGLNNTDLPVNVVVGTDKNETLNGTPNTDMIFSLLGANTINGLGGNDLLCGGNGVDTINGGDGDDTLGGNRGNDVLNGEGGNDTLTGGQGADRFSGGPGSDTATDFTPSQGDTHEGVENQTVLAAGVDEPAITSQLFLPTVQN